MSKVVRCVNFSVKHDEEWLKSFIRQEIDLQGDISNVYCRTSTELNLHYAYVVFNLVCDAEETAKYLNKATCEGYLLNVEIIGPGKSYSNYTKEANIADGISGVKRTRQSVLKGRLKDAVKGNIQGVPKSGFIRNRRLN